jgi:hypothetical protein
MTNRIRRFSFDVPMPSATAAVQAPAIPPGFAACPVPAGGPLSPWVIAFQQAVYTWAYERAYQAAQVPRHYRLMFASWN